MRIRVQYRRTVVEIREADVYATDLTAARSLVDQGDFEPSGDRLVKTEEERILTLDARYVTAVQP